MRTIHLATGLCVRDDRVLLVASRYANHPQPLWNLPGGRQKPGELLAETVVREVFEETGLRVRVCELAYVSESYDGGEHFVNATFVVALAEPYRGVLLPDRDHVVAAEWVPIREIATHMTVAIVREPLLAFLHSELTLRYAGFHEAGITVRWPRDSA